MEVVVSRSGGFAGVPRTWRVDLDGRPDVSDWVVLLQAVPWDDPPPPSPAPDRYQYRICWTPHEATVGERQLHGPWRELVDRVRHEAEPAPTSPRPRDGAGRRDEVS